MASRAVLLLVAVGLLPSCSSCSVAVNGGAVSWPELVSTIPLPFHADAVASDGVSSRLYYAKEGADTVHSVGVCSFAVLPSVNLTQAALQSNLSFHTPLQLASVSVRPQRPTARMTWGIRRCSPWTSRAVYSTRPRRQHVRAVVSEGQRGRDRLAASSAINGGIRVLALPSAALLYSVAVVASSCLAFDSSNHLFIAADGSVLEYDDYGLYVTAHNAPSEQITPHTLTVSGLNNTLFFTQRRSSLCWLPPASLPADSSGLPQSSYGCINVSYIASSPSALTLGPGQSVIGMGVDQLLVFGTLVATA